MAFRIDNSVVRGEIDNREKGIVRGKIWVIGRTEPVILELKGNAWPDLAGCLLKFENRGEQFAHAHLDSLQNEQQGNIGDLTASHKVRVFDVPIEQAYMMKKRGENPPEHMANCLYLEWFSQRNGRVVIESVDYELEISAPEWRLTPEEEKERAKQAAEGMTGFLKTMTDAIEAHQSGQKDAEEDWDEHDYERFMKESDARGEKFGELLDKFGDSEEAEERISEEMGWNRELTEEEAEEERRWIEEMNAACEEAANAPPPEPEPHREGIDWIRTEDGDLRHPLQHRAYEGALKFLKLVEESEADANADDVGQFLFEWQTASVKLAGALSGVAEGEGFRDAAFTVAYLKRALNHLHQSQAGLQNAIENQRLPESLAETASTELMEIRQEILRLMDEFRGRE